MREGEAQFTSLYFMRRDGAGGNFILMEFSLIRSNEYFSVCTKAK